MVASLEEVKHRIKNPKGTQDFHRSKRKRWRTDVHADVLTDINEYRQGHIDILNWIKKFVLNDEESFKSLEGIIRPPFPTNELYEKVFQDVTRIFNGQDFFQKFYWNGENKDEEAKDFLERIGDAAFWENRAPEVYATNIDAYIVCDRPRVEPAENGEPAEKPEDTDPFYYILDPERIISIKLERDYKETKSIIEVCWICFRCGDDEDDKEIAYFDEDQIIVFKDESLTEIEIGPIQHKIGWCPVAPFWQTTLNSKTLFLKRNRATKALSDFDWLFFYEYAKRWQDLNNPFPMWAMYDVNCQYQDAEGNKCERGYVNYMYKGEPMQKVCPSCANRFKRGPNRVVKVPAPQSKEDPDLLAHLPIQTISADVKNMEFVTNEVKRLHDFIMENCAGISSGTINKQAINQDQVATSNLSREAILIWEKRNFDAIRNWTTNTILKMQFGDVFLGCETDHGENMFLEDEMDQINEYKIAKESNLPNYELKTRREELMQSRYRNNPPEFERAKLMASLEPFPDYTLSDIINLRKSDPESVSTIDLIIKKNFSNFIDRFEAENGDISLFGTNLTKKGNITNDGQRSLKVRLNKIKEQLISYANEELAVTRGSGNTAGGSGTTG